MAEPRSQDEPSAAPNVEAANDHSEMEGEGPPEGPDHEEMEPLQEKELMLLAKEIPHTKYEELCDALGCTFAEGQSILATHLKNYKKAQQQILVDWKNKTTGTQLRTILARKLHVIDLGALGDKLSRGEYRRDTAMVRLRNISDRNRFLLWLFIPAAVVILAIVFRMPLQANECASSPCLSGGSCMEFEGTYSCICKAGFSGSRCEDEYISETLSLKELQGLLQDEYNRRLFKIHMKPWDPYDFVNLNKLFTTVKLHKKDKNNSPSESLQAITLNGSLNDIFQTEVDGTLPMRIVLVGEAGSGKTTAVAKMAYDWAYKVEGSPLKDTPLLFVLKMRHMNKKANLTEGIVRLLGKKYKKVQTQLKDFIDNHEEDVAILFDGYDEYSGSIDEGGDVSDVIDILRYDSCKKCRVLVTTRPFRGKDFDFGDPSSVYTKMELEGYSSEQAMDFIDRFFYSKETKRDELKEYLKEEDVMRQMITTPILCTLVCHLWNENRLKGSYTRTSFFDNIMKFLLQHAKSKKDESRLAIMTVNLHDLLRHVGQVAFEKLCSSEKGKELLFTDLDFVKSRRYQNLSYEIGLLTTSTYDDDFEISRHTEFFHKLAQEYAAGKYLAYAFNDNIISNAIKSSLIEVLRFASGTSDLACEKLLSEVIQSDGHDISNDLPLILKGDADKCGDNMESTWISFLQKRAVLIDKPLEIVGFDKLQKSVKNKIKKLGISMSSLSADALGSLLENLRFCSSLESLHVSDPVLQTDASAIHTKESHRTLKMFWNILLSYKNLATLKFNFPSTIPQGLQPLRNVKKFTTEVAGDPHNVAEILDLFPAVQELQVEGGRYFKNKVNEQFHDIFLSLIAERVMKNNVSLQAITVLLHQIGGQTRRISHDTLAAFIDMMKSSPEIQEVNILDIGLNPLVFTERDLLELIKSVRSTTSLRRFTIYANLNIDPAGEFYTYMSRVASPGYDVCTSLGETVRLSDQCDASTVIFIKTFLVFDDGGLVHVKSETNYLWTLSHW